MINLLRARRSVRTYTAAPIEHDKVNLLVEALLRSPTSRNINPWEFIIVDDLAILAKLSTAKDHGSSFLKGARLGIVICADCTQSDVWVEDCAIAAILVQLTAQSLGLGSCWIQIRKRQHDERSSAEKYVQRQLGLPGNVRVLAMISIGYPDEDRSPLPADELEFAKVKHNHHNSYWRS